MFPALAAIPAAAALIGQIGGSSALSMYESKTNRKKDFEAMRNLRGTTYLDTMKDMKAAGLNPILASKLGGSSAASISGKPSSNPAAAMQAGTAKKLAQEQADLMWTQRQNISANTDKSRMETYNLERQKEILEEQVNTAKMHNDVLRATLPHSKMMGGVKGHDNMKALYQIGEVFRAFNPFVNSATQVMRAQPSGGK